MTISADTKTVMEQISEGGLLRHGFADYLRDYELLVGQRGFKASPDLPDGYRVVFRNCVFAEATSSVRPDVWRRSLGNYLLDTETAREDETDPDDQGYVWGIKMQFVDDGGGEVVEPSARAAEWSEAVGIEFCELALGGNAHNLRLVYSGITIEAWDPATLRRPTDSGSR